MFSACIYKDAYSHSGLFDRTEGFESAAAAISYVEDVASARYGFDSIKTYGDDMVAHQDRVIVGWSEDDSYAIGGE